MTQDPQARSMQVALATSTRQLTPLWAVKVVYCVGTGSSACLWKFITVYYHHVGLTNSQIGLVQLLNPVVGFVSQLAWAALCDKLGSYKEVLIVSNLCGVACVTCLLLQPVQSYFPLLCGVVLLGSMFMASRGSVSDSMTLQVVKDYEEFQRDAERRGQTDNSPKLPSYGQQRLWGAAGWGGASLLGGYLMDAFGVPFMFVSAGILVCTTVAIIACFYPGRLAQREANQSAERENGSMHRAQNFKQFSVLWFFTNLFLYGMCMALVETYLFIFLLRDFDPPASKLLLGSTIAVMCLFEMPVFFYVDRLFARFSMTALLSFCHMVFALRCVIYTILPRSCVATVLLTEPLHGVTFALMWSAAVEYGKRIAPQGAEARMQALLNGLYYQLAIGCGSMFWGVVTESQHLGFRSSYLTAAVFIVLWSCIWNLGWLWYRSSASGGDAAPPTIQT